MGQSPHCGGTRQTFGQQTIIDGVAIRQMFQQVPHLKLKRGADKTQGNAHEGDMSGKIQVESARGLAMDIDLAPLYFCPKTMT